MSASLPPQALFLARLRDLTARGETLALVTVSDTKGSAPRETGATMAVMGDGSFFGTIGGGALEWEAQAIAREAIGQALREGRSVTRRIDRALGPDLGQCCGGRVVLDIRTLSAGDDGWLAARIGEAKARDARRPVVVFGAGHVGRALVLALAPLPFRVTWVDGGTRPSHPMSPPTRARSRRATPSGRRSPPSRARSFWC